MIDKNIYKLLTEFGLSEDQVKVYLAALELGEASMQDLATKSGVKRTSIYNFIKELIDKKLIITGKNKKRITYAAIHPEQLVEYEKVKILELQRFLPELLTIYNQSKGKPKVTFHEGKDGINEVFVEMLKEKQPINAWSDYGLISDEFDDKYFDGLFLERAKQQIVSRNIVSYSPKAWMLSKDDAKYLRETKFCTNGEFKTEITICGNKVALNNYREEKPFSVLIEDEAVAHTLRTIWESVWKSIES